MNETAKREALEKSKANEAKLRECLLDLVADHTAESALRAWKNAKRVLEETKP